MKLKLKFHTLLNTKMILKLLNTRMILKLKFHALQNTKMILKLKFHY